MLLINLRQSKYVLAKKYRYLVEAINVWASLLFRKELKSLLSYDSLFFLVSQAVLLISFSKISMVAFLINN